MLRLVKRITGIVLAVVAAAALLGSGFWLGWNTGREVPKNIVISGVTNIATPTTTAADFNTFWQAWATINSGYLRNPSTTPQNKVYGAIRGLVGSLKDPYSEFFTPEGSKQFQEDIAGDFGGIGAQLDTNANGKIVVVAPLKGTPAEAAGLKAKDRILAVNATSTERMTVDEAVRLIRGPEGTVVTLTIMRDGWEKPKDIKITRAKIQVPVLDLEMKGDIARISLHEFTRDADLLFYQTLVKTLTANAKGIVLDLRDNPGGYLEVAVNISGYFIKPGLLVVTETGRTISDKTFRAPGEGALADFPLVVLINGGSASASEILAGALRDNRGTKLVGETSFGKGTVQELKTLSDGSAIKLTIAHWVLPSGRILNHDGLKPDYEVKLSDDDIAAKRDPQLKKAMEILRTEIAGQGK